PSNRGLSATAVGALAASPGPDGTLLASTQLGLFRSADLGAHWAQVLGRTPYTLVFHPLLPGTVYAGAIDGLYKSTDSGLTWQIAQGTGAPLSLWSTLAIDPIHPQYLYALGRRRNGPQEAAGGARSTDGGATWIDMAIDSTVAYSLTLDPRRPERLYASTSRG